MMRGQTLCLLVVLMLSYASASITTSVCQYIVEDAVYSLLGLGVQSIITSDNQNITFKLCESNLLGCPLNDTTPSNIDVTALVNPDLNGDCQNIADARLPVASFFNESNENQGVTLTYPPYTNGTVDNILEVTIICDADISFSNITWTATVTENDDGSTTYSIIGIGAPGCPIITLESYLTFFNKYRPFFCGAFVVIGVFALLAGLQFFNVTIFVFTAFAVTGALFILIFAFAGLQTTNTIEWVIFGLCLVVALACGYGAIKFKKVGFFVLGALLGVFGALFLYSLLLHFFQLSEVVMYAIIAVLALAGGLLGLWLWKDIIILSTSCVGSYLLVRGVSFYVGGFPNEVAVARGLKTLDLFSFAYLAVIVVVAILGMIFQFKRKKRAEEKEKELAEEDSVTKPLVKSK